MLFSLVCVTMHPGPQTSNLIFTLKWNLCGNHFFSAFVKWNLTLSTSSKTPAWFCKCLNCVLIFKSTSVSIQLCVSLLDRGFVLFLTCNSRNLVVAFPTAGEIYVYFWSTTVDKILQSKYHKCPSIARLQLFLHLCHTVYSSTFCLCPLSILLVVLCYLL